VEEGEGYRVREWGARGVGGQLGSEGQRRWGGGEVGV